MKVYKKNFKDLFFELGIDSFDDLWALSIFICPGDHVGMHSTRRFRVQEGDDSEKKSVFINLEVKSLKLELEHQTLKVIGIIESGHPSEYVIVGQHHSFDLRSGDRFSIKKTNLLDIHKRLLDKFVANKPKKTIYLGIIDDDSCLVASLNESRYEVITEISFKGSGKREGTSRNNNKNMYYDSILKLISSLEFDSFVFGGPGFEKEYFQKYLFEKIPANIKSKFIFTNVSSPGISGIKELLNGGAIKNIISELNVQRDSDLINEFLLHLSKEKPVTYGLIQVKEALDKNALKLVIISDKFFLENFSELKNLILLFEDKNVEYHILNSGTESGKILDNLTGIAAFLYY